MNEQSPSSKRERWLNIGGESAAPRWEVFNANQATYVDHVGNANDLSRFSEHSFAKIYVSHVVEHLDYSNELVMTLAEWCRTLIHGGSLHLTVPDIDILPELFLAKV